MKDEKFTSDNLLQQPTSQLTSQSPSGFTSDSLLNDQPVAQPTEDLSEKKWTADNLVPSDVQAAKSGKLVNPNTKNSDFSGWCQAFVEKAQGSSEKYPTAYDAWTSQKNKAVQGTKGIQPGDAIYFYPNHTGIYMGNDQFISATDNGVESHDLNEWGKLTGQQVLGYIPQRKGIQ